MDDTTPRSSPSSTPVKRYANDAHVPSPSNTSSSALAIPAVPHPSSGKHATGHRKSLTPHNTPDRFIPRTPLTFLSNSPSTPSIYTASSVTSSLDWHIQTPTSSAGTTYHLVEPWATSTPRKSSGSSLGNPLHIEISSSGSSYSIDGSTIDASATAPSPLRKMDHLFPIPSSPPIILPSAQLLELSPNIHPDANTQHSIASPFVNLNSSPSPRSVKPGPVSYISPLNSARRRDPAALRRGSNLSHQMNALDLDDSRADDPTYDADDDDTDDGVAPAGDALVPWPAPSHPSSSALV